MGSKTKTIEVVTLKMDQSLINMMKGIVNRSEFIRLAILAALDNICPFCKGTGVLTPHRKKHWDDLASHHKTHVCRDCDETVLECKTKKR